MVSFAQEVAIFAVKGSTGGEASHYSRLNSDVVALRELHAAHCESVLLKAAKVP